MVIWQKVAKLGYGWYLALKIGKAVIAIPYFPIVMAACLALSLLVWLWECAKSAWTIAVEVPDWVTEYWRSKWFSGFGRSYYASLSMYRKEPISVHVEEIE